MAWEFLAPLIALAITLCIMLVAVAVVRLLRKRAYRLFENKSEESLAQKFSLPAINQSPAEDRRKALSPGLKVVHEAANAAQNRYHNAVAGSAGCLVAAFIAMVIGTLPQQDWILPSWLHADYHSVEYVLTWIDAIAVILVLVLFLYARLASQRWLVARAGVELLRQYQFLTAAIPSSVLSPHIANIKLQFDLEEKYIKLHVQEGLATEIISRICKFWSERKALFETTRLEENDISADSIVMYLKRRAIRQLGWFSDSTSRLEHAAEWRTKFLLILYYMAAALAVVKLSLFMYDIHSPYILRCLLIITGMSAAMTGYYINTNARSLIHRYTAEQRQISEWLDSFNKRWPFADIATANLDSAAKAEIRGRICEFEEVLIQELIDWLHITSHDAIELSP